LYDLSDLSPAKLHMTVPKDFRRSSDIPGILVRHYADLPASDVQTAQGFKFTRPLRTILDLLEAGTVEQSAAGDLSVTGSSTPSDCPSWI